VIESDAVATAPAAHEVSLGTTALVYGPPPGHGGSGLLVQQVLTSLTRGGATVHALGPSSRESSSAIIPHEPPRHVSPWMARYGWLRWNAGRLELLSSRRRGAWAARQLPSIQPRLGYAFSEVALETLRWCRDHGIATVLDSASGGIRDFHEVLVAEYARWCDSRPRGHPITAMVDRVEEEYRLADRIRAASTFTRDTIVAAGVPGDKVSIVRYPMDLGRFPLRAIDRTGTGPLRICYVGAIALHKGFPYLLRAARKFGPSRLSVRLVGGTVDRESRTLLARERAGLDVTDGASRDVVAELHQCDILVHPSLHDGFGYVVPEAMAAGLPVIVTDRTGAADWVREGETGWIVPARDVDALAKAIDEALVDRSRLAEMGRAARTAVVSGRASSDALFRWVAGGAHAP
jgi:glycosyltransferase involved in cell wall biosynthesis